ncbi:MAG: thioesterase family protein [Anaerolineae bacterium]
MEGYRHLTPMMIRFADLDRLDHVNNAKYLTYIEQGRIQYVDDLTELSGLSRLRMIVAKATIEYKLPLDLKDKQVNVWSRVSRIGTKSFTMEHALLRGSDDALAATGEIIVVCYDYDAQQAVPMTPEWRAFITEYEPGLS